MRARIVSLDPVSPLPSIVATVAADDQVLHAHSSRRGIQRSDLACRCRQGLMLCCASRHSTGRQLRWRRRSVRRLPRGPIPARELRPRDSGRDHRLRSMPPSDRVEARVGRAPFDVPAQLRPRQPAVHRVPHAAELRWVEHDVLVMPPRRLQRDGQPAARGRQLLDQLRAVSQHAWMDGRQLPALAELPAHERARGSRVHCVSLRRRLGGTEHRVLVVPPRHLPSDAQSKPLVLRDSDDVRAVPQQGAVGRRHVHALVPDQLGRAQRLLVQPVPHDRRR